MGFAAPLIGQGNGVDAMSGACLQAGFDGQDDYLFE